MTRAEKIAITMLTDMRDGLHETGKDFPYRDECIPYMKEACDKAIEALRQQDRILQILDDCDLEAWEILEKIKEVVRVNVTSVS